LTREELSETQVRIYLYIATHRGKHSVRDIARALELSPSTVHYNLKRLEELGYIARGRRGYIVRKPIRLRDYVILGRLVVPRLVIYGVFFTGVFTGTLVYSVLTGFNKDRSLVLVISLLAALLFYIEAYRVRVRVFS